MWGCQSGRLGLLSLALLVRLRAQATLADPSTLPGRTPRLAPCLPTRSCYTNCARWKDLHYSLIRTYELANGDAPGALATKVADEVESALAQVRLRIAGGGASNSGPPHRRT